MTTTFPESKSHLRYQIIVDDEIRTQAAQAIAQGRKLDLRNDIVFKSFFSKECKESAYCRRKLLSAVIGRTVTDTTVLNPELLPTRTDGKFPRLDIHCRLDDGSEVDVDMQNSMYDDDQIKRTIYYAATLTHNALSSGKSYAELPQIYQIMFMNFKVTRDERLHHSYTFTEREDHTELSDIVQIHHIELPKIKKVLKEQPEELSELEFWSILIMAHEKKGAWELLTKLADRKEEIEMAQTLLNTMSVDQQEWENQIGYELFLHDCASRENSAYRRGERAGLQQGISQGIASGAREKALETARNALAMNLTVEQAAQISSLSIEEVQEIAGSIQA